MSQPEPPNPESRSNNAILCVGIGGGLLVLSWLLGIGGVLTTAVAGGDPAALNHGLFFLLTVVIGKWAGVSGAGAGFKVGALLGLMVGFGIDLTLFGVTNMANITATLVDPFVFATQMGCAGAVVGIVLARIK